MKVLFASHLTFDVRWSMRRHAHERFHELIVLTAGAIRTTLDSAATPVTARAGDSLLYPQGDAHAEESVGSGPVKMVCISFESAGYSGPILSPDIQGRVRLLADWMTELLPSSAGAGQQTRDALMQAILAERLARATQDDPIVQQVRRYVREHLAEPVGLGDLADLCCLSRYHFARRFRIAAGSSPMDFVRTLRVEAARVLMMTSPGLPLRAVARAVGLVNEFHLSRVYKRVTGYPPTSVRSTPRRFP